MSTKAELQALLERVKAATGPDREIDHAIAEVVWGKCDFGSGRYAFPPPVTASLDAITALIERELPGWWCDFRLGTIPPHLPKGRAVLWNSDRRTRESINGCVGDAATPALALTAAFLSAIIAQMEPSHAE